MHKKVLLYQKEYYIDFYREKNTHKNKKKNKLIQFELNIDSDNTLKVILQRQ
jgi:hypothetical protein